MLQANAYLGLEQPMAAAVNLEAVRMMGKAQTSSLVLLGDIYMNAGMSELAKSAYLEVIRNDAKGAQLETALRAVDLLLRTHADADAEELIGSIQTQYAKKLDTDDELRLLTLKARLARAQGKGAQAAELLESIVRRDGTRGDALLELATYYGDHGQREKAILLVKRAAKVEGFEQKALVANAQMMVSERKYAEAAELLHQAQENKYEPRIARYLSHVEQAIVPE
jgi:Tfp pilus assembly protein PilF